MEQPQRIAPPQCYAFVKCIAKNINGTADARAVQPAAVDTRELSPAEYAHILQKYFLHSVTHFASENDCIAVSYSRPVRAVKTRAAGGL